ncbi:hypothetical protein CAOG_07234 [Capsaspora owczarzaki ATCC 30864]|uniref:ER membrane protein complex subunit 6 n=1 Tax=Capsaspora owczarzaki (strain ATCC 30864) TaxID=595528 RepID=A0A0D2X583_CAPO3|nr:hypothetical protein CAOG_07234 [Capsaspora owczarzaki ATCC 30864]KJE97359.1 hypothetical protein CAOG_007234 [Capsaspora owczarzaki ATCC 30864]|eukprot:XP_004343093.1 hypothetical protein CAOG_07234 [Capsaspora owczarzaki ATCC 30864]
MAAPAAPGNAGNGAAEEVERFDATSMRFNTAVIGRIRTGAAVISGSTAGILGLTGLYGFGFYFVASLLLSLLLFVKAKRNVAAHFSSPSAITTDGLFDGLSTYVLLWTFMYGMVHVY